MDFLDIVMEVQALPRADPRGRVSGAGEHDEHGQVSRTADEEHPRTVNAEGVKGRGGEREIGQTRLPAHLPFSPTPPLPFSSSIFMYDTIIIGTGMSGLAAGIRLAHFDRRVCILERHTTIGGLNSFYRLRGRNFDVGLHAITNYTTKGARRGPLARLLRQLRLSWDDLGLAPQTGSEIAFPGVRLRLSNDFELLLADVRRAFPGQQDKLQRLVAELVDYDDLPCDRSRRSARGVVGEIIDDPLLLEMLFCPLLFYGSASEQDLEFGQFSILFRSIFQEGFARPWEGVRRILKKLVRRYKELGGELPAGRREPHRRPRRRGGEAGAGRRHGADGPPRALLGRLARDRAALRRGPARRRAAGRANLLCGIVRRPRSPAARAWPRPQRGVLQRFPGVRLPRAGRPG